jgi:uncharacterized membrane protein YhaH (DUF805 family)
MTFLESIKTCLTDKYATFSGRASRSEFWWFVLFCMIISLTFDTFFPFDIPVDFMDIDKATLPSQYSSIELRNMAIHLIVNLILAIPYISVSIRRLHDVGRSAWWQLASFTGIGVILILYWSFKKGTPGPNRFGEDPLQNNNESPLIEG